MPGNYMSQFSGSEDFIRAQVIANHGNKSIVPKAALVNDVIHYKLHDSPEKLSKAELFDILVAGLGDRAYHLYPIGISSINWQNKFGIAHKDVQTMAKGVLIAVTGKVEFRLYGRTCFADTYSPWDYFRLTPEVVHAWLADKASTKRKKV